jgi:hypothetical protein
MSRTHEINDEMDQLRQYYLGELDRKDGEIERLRAREAQARTIILAAGVYVPLHGGWAELWHRDADKWVGDKT